MKSITSTLRRFALASVALIGACYSAGDKDGNDMPGGGGQCTGFAPVACRCVNGDTGLAECDDGVRGACVCDGNGGTTSIAGNGGTISTAGTAGTTSAGTGGTLGVAGEGGSGGVFVPECTPGTFEACSCSIADGYTICHPPGSWGECTCGTIFAEGDELPSSGGAGGDTGSGGADTGGAGAGGDTGSACTPTAETCDSADNDCDGEVDNGYVCADDVVAHIVTQTRGVYLQGTTNEASCGYDVLQQFWPTLDDSYYDGFNCGATRYLFRRADNQIFYATDGDGILENTAFGMDLDSLTGTSPCGFAVAPGFDFDSNYNLHYQCDDTVRRAGTLVTTPVTRVIAVLDDGRIIATRDDSEFAVFDAAGGEQSVFPAAGGVAGTFTINENSVVVGNTAYLSLLRVYDSENEVMVLRVNESSEWQLVRRLVVPDFGTNVIASPEGTVLVRRVDPDSGVDEQIVAYMVDGTDFVVWSEVDSETVKSGDGVQLLPGPLQ